MFRKILQLWRNYRKPRITHSQMQTRLLDCIISVKLSMGNDIDMSLYDVLDIKNKVMSEFMQDCPYYLLDRDKTMVYRMIDKYEDLLLYDKLI